MTRAIASGGKTARQWDSVNLGTYSAFAEVSVVHLVKLVFGLVPICMMVVAVTPTSADARSGSSCERSCAGDRYHRKKRCERMKRARKSCRGRDCKDLRQRRYACERDVRRKSTACVRSCRKRSNAHRALFREAERHRFEQRIRVRKARIQAREARRTRTNATGFALAFLLGIGALALVARHLTR
ncbi:MAG: hypothetical protein AAFY64_02025 [Pseudomonadota bacterium]